MTAISKVLTGMIEGRMVGYHLAAILAGYLLDHPGTDPEDNLPESLSCDSGRLSSGSVPG